MSMQSEKIGELLTALSKAQARMQGAVEDSNNPFFKSKYADLTSVWGACRKALTDNGLSVVQTIQMIEGVQCLVSILGHTSGEWIKSSIIIKPGKDDIQSLGSTLTYLRRYSLSALVGISPKDEEDDGEAAMVRFEIPDGIKKESVDKFIENLCLAFKSTPDKIKKGAIKDPDKFWDKFYEWQKEQAKT